MVKNTTIEIINDYIMLIAIVGCGQLSSMLALAGNPIGIKFIFTIQDYIIEAWIQFERQV